ncbi:effector-associated domain EAD1-containing protein [Hyalangium sp.]|uniref:phosphorylase family protein n=1 Tax=Hyalangium sp. TaxID=2028555 RepID=UPI002D4A89F4|nr:effector-associated domain EAD1-containing protein [Hyalangium sp.]HYH96084.1 effector-associated domain EAD1-containing protein [Hyalangium sp.]
MPVLESALAKVLAMPTAAPTLATPALELDAPTAIAGASAPRIDVLIITAVKEEYDEALKVDDGALDAWDKRPGPTGLEVAFRTYQAATGAPMRVALTRALEMRGVAAANSAWPLITAYKPWILAMCGVCAGRRGEVNLGDVVVGSILYTYDTGAIVAEYDNDGTRHERFKGEPGPYRIPAVWQQRAESFMVPADAPWLVLRPRTLEDQGLWLMERLVAGEDPAKHPDRAARCSSWAKVIERLRKLKRVTETGLALTTHGRAYIDEKKLLHPDGLPKPEEFRARVGPLATGNDVVRDPRIFDRLSESMRKVLGVEMEAAAIGAIAHLTDIRMLVMKGVMDHADDDKDDGFKMFAARAAAECLLAFLRNWADLLPGKGEAETAVAPVQTGHPSVDPPAWDTRSIPMTALPLDLIHVLAEEYPDVRDARAVWERAGGKASEVENISRPRDLWQRLWVRSMQGASARPAALLRSALADLPRNSVLIHSLKAMAQPTTAEAAANLITRLEATKSPLHTKGTLELLEDWKEGDGNVSFAAICPALAGHLSPARRSELQEILSRLAVEMQTGALSGTVNVATAAVVEALLAALEAT